jgi:molybdopterin-containing oxidoreductase family membrane subunit
MYLPTGWDWATYLGTFGLFFTLFILFARFLPAISMFEMRSLLTETAAKDEATHGTATTADLRADGRVQHAD